MATVVSPLRYPGGKTRGRKFILPLLDGNELASPFLGGASVEIASGVPVDAADNFDALVNFWVTSINDADSVADRVESLFPCSPSKFKTLQQKIRDYVFDGMDPNAAAEFFTVNRCSFSGTTVSGGMSPGHPRFTTSSIERLRLVTGLPLSVKRESFEVSIPRMSGWMYLDPPYIVDSNLYGVSGSLHRDFDHDLLYQVLRERTDPWVLSYGENEWVRTQYRDFNILETQWSYGMSSPKVELVIRNDAACTAYGGH